MTVDFTAQPCVWMAGYPRSGNTWINYLFAYCLNLPFRDFDNPAVVPEKPWVRDAVSGRQPWPAPAGFQAVVKTHKLPSQVPFANGRVVYLQRDPRDVFVSHDHFIRHRMRRSLKKYHYQLLGLGGRTLQVRWFVHAWMHHVAAWRRHNHVVVHYEQLRRAGVPYLSACLQTLGFVVPEERVQNAMELFRFERLSGGRRNGEADQKSFYRRGAVGDWNNHLSEMEHRLFAPALTAAQVR